MDSDCSHEIKKTFDPCKKSYDKPRQCIKKKRHHFANKGHIVKAIGFPVVMYGCENWNIKKTEHQWTDAFELWYWRRLLRDPWTARRSSQSILKEINPAYSLEGLMLKLKLQYFGHLMVRADLLEKIPMLGTIEGRTRRQQKRMRYLDGITDSMDISLNISGKYWRRGKPGMGSQRMGHDWVTEQQYYFILL